MTVVRWGFESGANGDGLNATNASSTSVSVSGGSASISTAWASSGTRSALMTATSTNGTVIATQTFSSTTTIAVDLRINWTTLPSAETKVIILLDTGNAQTVQVGINNLGRLVLRDAGGTSIFSSATSMVTGTEYRVSLFATQNATTGTVRAAYYAGGGTTAIADSGLLTGQNTGANPFASIRRGVKCSTATVTGVAAFDDWAYDTAASGLLAPAGPPPVAVMTASLNGLTLSVDGSGSSATGPATISSYDWDWGDATSHGTGATPTHAYSAAGTYTVILTVTDSTGSTGSVSYSVQVAATSGLVGAGIVYANTGWILAPSSGMTEQAILNDTDGTTFLQSPTNPTAGTQWVPLGKVNYASGQGLQVNLVLDRITGSSGTVTVALKEGANTITGAGGTTRGTVSSVAVATGTNGSAVINLVTATFNSTQAGAVTDWGNVGVLLSFTGS